MSRPVSAPLHPAPPPRPKSSFWLSLRVALAGAGEVLRTERNAQLEAAVAGVAIGLGLALGISGVEWALILVLIGLVLGLEMVNTAVEAAVDLACPERHPLAKKAKDAAAGAVVLAALVSVGVGIVIFLPRLWSLLSAWLL